MSELKLEDFIISYPQYKKPLSGLPDSDKDLFNIYDDTVQRVNYRKAEFYENKLDLIEELPQREGNNPPLLKDQIFIARFLSPKTLNDGILIQGKTGTGKTIKSIAASELAQQLNPRMKKTLILVKGEGIERNFKQQLALVYNPQKYLPQNYDLLTEDEKIRRMNKLIDENYEFHTFITFTKYLKSTPNDIIKKIYSDRVVIIDEAHNLRLQDKKEKDLKVYETIHNFLHIILNKKIILLTGTPMKDKPDEIATLMNLLLPLDTQMPTGKEFYKMFFINNHTTLKNKELLADYLRGRVSYVRGMESNITRNYIGSINGNMKKINTITCNMSDFQTKYYTKFYKEDIGSKPDISVVEDELGEEEADDDEHELSDGTGFYDKSRQASLFVFPDGTTASEGFNKYLVLDKRKKYVLTSEFEKQLTNNYKATQLQILANIRKYSCKYADVLREILDNPHETAFVYTKYVKGSGAILFGELLRLLNYKSWDKNDTSTSKKYVVISRKTITSHETDTVLEKFNNPDNKYGDVIGVVIGSAVMGEGRTLKNIRQIHIITPHWNNSETEQAIGRGIRAFSHDSLPLNQRFIKIFRWCSIPHSNTRESKDIPSIDLYFYKMSEDKDLSIKQVERVIKTTAVDCQLNKLRNLLPSDKDYSSECLYDKCAYKCDGFEEPMTDIDLIDDTYNLFYGDNEIAGLSVSIKNLFRKKFNYYITNFFNIFVDTPQIIVIRTLKYLIDNNIEIKNKYNFPCYLREDYDFYFLVDKVALPNYFTLNEYTQHPVVNGNLNFNQILKLCQYKYLTDKIDIINLTLENEEDIHKQLDTFPMDIQQQFLETAIINVNSSGYGTKKKKPNKLNNTVISHFKNFIIKQPDGMLISTLLMDTQDKLRCFVPDEKHPEWTDCDPQIYEELEDIKEMEKFSLENSNINYYGIISKKKGKKESNEFRIKFKDQEEVVDKRKKNRGIVCSTVVPVQRIGNIAVDLQLNPPSSFKLTNKDKTIDEILKINKKLLEANHKDYQTKYTKNGLRNMTDKELSRIAYWYFEANKGNICSSIKDYFQANDILIYEK